MTKEQAVIKLRSTIEALKLKERFFSLAGGVMYLDTLHKPSCKGCPTGTSCGCTIAHPELYYECSRDKKENVMYLAKSENGKTHLFIPLKFQGDLAGYIRLESMPNLEPVGKLETIKKLIPTLDSSSQLLEFQQLFSEALKDGQNSANTILSWIKEAVEKLNQTLRGFSSSGTSRL